jgi:hypothetical protein
MSGQVLWLMLVILATWEADIGRTPVGSQFRKIKFSRPPSQLIKAEHINVCLSHQLCKKHKEEDHGSDWQGINVRPYSKAIYSKEGWR